jgi:acetoacetyl-CoA synthetase
LKPNNLRFEVGVEQRSTVLTTEQLAAIWQRVLRRANIRPNENFFAIGGNPMLAVEIFVEISTMIGREVSPLTIYQAPTIALLAATLEKTAFKFPTLVQLRDGSGGTPVFVTHGLNGSLMEIFNVVDGLPPEYPVYGLQLRGFDGREEPFSRVEDAAQCFLEKIKEVHPTGPFALIGYSFGGLVMFEVARRIVADGEPVAILAMVEAYPYRTFLPLEQRLLFFGRMVQRHIRKLIQLPWRRKLAYLKSGSERWLTFAEDGLMIGPPESGIAAGSARQRYGDVTKKALMSYRPEYYPGKIKFVQADRVTTLFPHNAKAVWRAFAEEVDVKTVPGDHFGIVTTHYRELSAVLGRYLTEAVAEGPRR